MDIARCRRMLPTMDATQQWVEQLATHLTLGEFFNALAEECAPQLVSPQLVAQWTHGDVLRALAIRLS